MHIDVENPYLPFILLIFPLLVPKAEKVLLISAFIVSFKILIRQPVMFNSSQDAVFVGCMLPFLPRKWWALAVPLFAIAISKSIAALLCIFCFGVLVWGAWVLGVIPFMLVLIKLSHDGGRVVFWEKMLSLIWDRPFFGYGPGSFMPWSVKIENVNETPALFLYAHNSYLEILFEYGAVGLTCALVCLAYGFYKQRSDREKLTALAAFSLSAFTQMNINHPLMILLLVYLFRLRKEKQGYH